MADADSVSSSPSDLEGGPAPFLRPTLLWLGERRRQISRHPVAWALAVVATGVFLIAQYIVMWWWAVSDVEAGYERQGITDGGGYSGDVREIKLAAGRWLIAVAIELTLIVTVQVLRRIRLALKR